MKAALFTLFAKTYVQDTIIPRLRGRGIHVMRTLEPRDAAKTRITEDLVLFMHEFGPHANDRIVREAAKAQGKRFSYLTRKAGSWPAELRDDKDVPTEASEVEVTLLPVERLDAMLKTMAALRDIGQGYDVIVPQLQHFWRPGETPPADSRALRRLMETVRERGEPKWFVSWKPAAQPPVSGPGAYAPPDVAPDEDDAELLKMFEQDNERLQGELRAERDAVVQLRKELADALDAGNVWKEEYDKLHKRFDTLVDQNEADRRKLASAEQLSSGTYRDVGELRARLQVLDQARQEDQSKLDAMNIAHQDRTADLAQARERIEELLVEIRDLHDSVRFRDQQIEKMQADPTVTCTPAVTNGLGKMLAQVRPLVPALLSAEEALDKLAAYAAKQES